MIVWVGPLSKSTKYLLAAGLLAASALAWVASLRARAAMPGNIAGFTALWRKMTCLGYCRDPLQFFMGRWRGP